MWRSLKLGKNTRELLILFTFVEFGNFNNKNIQKIYRKDLLGSSLKKKKKRVRFIFGLREIYGTVMNSGLAGRDVTESWLETGICKSCTVWAALPPAAGAWVAPSLVAPNHGILFGPRDTFAAVSFRWEPALSKCLSPSTFPPVKFSRSRMLSPKAYLCPAGWG